MTQKTTILATAALAVSASASTLITDVQSGISGFTVASDTAVDDSGYAYAQQGDTGWAELVDGNNGTNMNTWSGGAGAAGDLGYLGLRFNTVQTDVTSIQLDIQIFNDGGWFNGGEGVEPTIQYTTADISGWNSGTFISNGDNAWTTIASTTDYIALMNADTAAQANIAGVSDGQTFTWNFAAISGVTGIRIIGDQGGTASTTAGFLGGQEMRAYAVPEPSSVALLSLGGITLILRRKK